MGWKTGGPPSILVSNGKLITKPLDIANHMNNYFIEKIRTLKEKIPVNSEDPLKLLKRAMKNWEGRRNITEFELRDITLNELNEILRELKNTTTMGFDGLDAMTLKLAAPDIIKPLQHVLNTSMRTQVFCNKWKFTKHLPLYKGDGNDRNSEKSYRPISILPVVSKILEKAVQVQIWKFMK